VTCPETSTSAYGEKKRSRMSASAPLAGSTKPASMRSSAASDCIAVSLRPSASGTTTAGLPQNGRSENASTTKKGRGRVISAEYSEARPTSRESGMLV
jgi:hypothetical protein